MYETLSSYGYDAAFQDALRNMDTIGWLCRAEMEWHHAHLHGVRGVQTQAT
jgi:hypothetical protein